MRHDRSYRSYRIDMVGAALKVTKKSDSAMNFNSGVDFFDMSSRGSFGYEGYLLQLDALGQKPADFEVIVTPTGMRQPLVGYSATGPGARCRFKYRFEATGNVGDQIGSEPQDAAYTVWQKITTETYIGPLPCEGSATATGSL